MDVVERIKEGIEAIRPFLQGDGGDIEFVKYEDHIVYVKLRGHCAGCPSAMFTLKELVEVVLKEGVPEIEAVEALEY